MTRKSLIFSITLLAAGFSTYAQYTVLHSFMHPGGSLDDNALISDGTYLYGTNENMGQVYKIKPDGTGFTVLNSFNGSLQIGAGLVSDGTYLYGTTYNGGVTDKGTLFKVKTDGTGFATLWNFSGSDGSNPYGKLTSDGTYLYGTTEASSDISHGTIFKIKPDGTGFTTLHPFNSNGTEGGLLFAGLISDGAYLYGTALGDGVNNGGTIFKIKPDGTDFTVLHSFSTNGAEGGSPGALFSAGTYLYGTAKGGGANGVNYGTIYKIKPDGTGFAILYSFTDNTDCGEPIGALVSDDTYLYGTTRGVESYAGSVCNGTLFKVKPDGTDFTTLYTLSLTDTAKGKYFQGGLFSDGSALYGTTAYGGDYIAANNVGGGVVFKYQLGSTSDTSNTGDTGNTAIANISRDKNITIYPNPFTNSLTIRSNKPFKTITLMDVYGRRVLTTHGRQINTSSLSKGVYVLLIDEKYSGRVVKE